MQRMFQISTRNPKPGRSRIGFLRQLNQHSIFGRVTTQKPDGKIVYTRFAGKKITLDSKELLIAINALHGDRCFGLTQAIGDFAKNKCHPEISSINCSASTW